MEKKLITVLMIQYEPDKQKLRDSLVSILKQREIPFEIIVSDDGSKNDCFEMIKELFANYGFRFYKLIKNEINKGTVENYKEAVFNSSGEFIFSLSPGDILFDDHVILDMYENMVLNNKKICFGNAICYHRDNNQYVIDGPSKKPFAPQAFNSNNLENKKLLLVFHNYIVGTTILRETEFAKNNIEKLIGICKYTEDNTGFIIALQEGMDISYLNRDVVWYEYGCGISSTKEEKWKRVIKRDFVNCAIMLKEKYPKDRIIDAMYIYEKFSGNERRKMLWIKHPCIQIKRIAQMYYYNIKNKKSEKKYLVDDLLEIIRY